MTTQLETPIQFDEAQSEEPEKMASGLHGIIIGHLAVRLGLFIEDHNLGYIIGTTTTYNFVGNPPKRMPDLSFVSREKLSQPVDEELTVIPDLVIEVVSKNDTAYEVNQKVAHYQQVGVPLIWVIYPANQTVTVYRLADGPVGQIIGINGELDGETVVPGFRLAVSRLFK